MLALLALASTACPGERGAPLEPSRGIVLLGDAGLMKEIGDVSRPLLAGSAGRRASIALDGLPASRVTISVAAKRKFGPNADPHFDCRVELVRDEAREDVAALRISTRPWHWITREVELPEVDRGRLDFSCDRSFAVWGRPIAIPLDSAGPEPLVVLVSLDTLRADHVTGFGAAVDATPNLARLGDEGLRVLEATSSSTWTLPSHFELFTGSLARGNQGGALPAAWLPGLLAEAGFLTIGFTGGGYVSADFGLAAGFASFREYGAGIGDLEAQVRDAISSWRQPSVPVFVFFHTYAIHAVDPDHRAWIEEHRMSEPYQPDALQLANARAWYADRVHRTDAALAPLFDALREAAATRPTLLVVFSDHGESFLEHGLYGHGRRFRPYDELIRIPLIVWGPGLIPPGRSSATPQMLLDVAPSILAAVGVTNAAGMRGRNFWPAWSRSGESPSLEGPAVASTDQGFASRDAETAMLAKRSAGGEDPAYELELYDLATDPAQRDDLAARQPERARAVFEVLQRRLAEFGLPVSPENAGAPGASWGDPEELDPETIEELRSLGYLD